MEFIEGNTPLDSSVNRIRLIDGEINIRIQADGIEYTGIILRQLHMLQLILVHGLNVGIFQIFPQ